MRNKFILRIGELEKIRDDHNTRLEEAGRKIINNPKETSQEVKEKLRQTEAEIEKMHSSYCNYNEFIKRLRASLTRVPLKLMFRPLNNPKDEPKEQEKHEAYETHKTRTVFTRRLQRYTPVF